MNVPFSTHSGSHAHGLAMTAVLAVLLAGTGCHKKTPEPQRATERLPTAEVRARPVDASKHQATEEVVGTVQAKLRAVIEAKVAGRIEQMLASPGQKVRKGELLVQLDAREIQARLEQAAATREQAANDLKRFTNLLERQAATQAEFERVQAGYRVAQATLSETETMLGYTKVLAPFEGVITRKLADVGDLAAPGRPLLQMEDPGKLRLEANVPETLVDLLKPGARLRTRIANVEPELEGVVAEIAPTADPASRTFLVKFDLPETPGLRAGQFGRIAVPVSESTAVRVPVSAVIQRGQMEIVYVVTQSTAHLRLVKTGKRIGNEIELLSGIDPGETLVIEGAAGLIDGQPLTVRP